VFQRNAMHLIPAALVVGTVHYASTSAFFACPRIPPDKAGNLGYLLAGGVGVTICAMLGLYCAAVDPESRALWHSAATRMNGTAPATDTLMAWFLGYQTWNLGVTLAIPELQSWTNVLHHTGAIVATLVACRPYANAYVPFFFGIVELSSIPLTAADMARDLLLPSPAVKTAAKGLFRLSFVALRNVAWLAVGTSLARDIVAQSRESGTSPVFALTLLGCFTGLQFFWGWKIVRRFLASRAQAPVPNV